MSWCVRNSNDAGTPPGGAQKSFTNLVDKVITIALIILAVLSTGSIALSTKNYLQGISAARGVRLELSNLELRREDNSEVRITLHLDNRSSVNVQLDSFRFKLYLNGNFLGSNYYPLTERLFLDGFEETSVDFVVPLRPFYLQYIEQAGQKEDFSWLVRGEVRLLLLPFNENEIWLNIKEHWSGCW